METLFSSKGDNEFITISTKQLPIGTNSIEISVINELDKPDPNFISRAVVEIKAISFEGAIHGGAKMCLPVTEGWYAPEKSEAPTKCPAGQQTSSKKDSCKNCINGYYNPEEGKKCKRCPDFTFPNSERTKCVPYDRITTKYGNMFALYMLRPDQFCRKKENKHFCN